MNEYVRDDAPDMIAYASRNEITDVLVKAVKASDKCFVATNSRKEARTLEAVLKTSAPKARVVCITQDNSSQPEIQLILRNLAEYAQNYDVVIGSPTIGTGIDISVEHFNKTFVLGVQGSTTHRDLMQAAWRNRKAKEIHVWIDPKQFSEPTDLEFWRNYCLDKNDQTGLLIDFCNKTGAKMPDHRIPFQAEFQKLYGEVMAVQKASTNRLAANFYTQAVDEGHKIKLSPLLAADPDLQTKLGLDKLIDVIEIAETSQTEEEAATTLIEIKKSRKEAKAAIKEAHINSIVEAPEISEQEYQELCLKQRKTEAEKAQQEKHFLASYYVQEVTAELIEQDNAGKFRSKLKAFMIYTEMMSAEKIDLDSRTDPYNPKMATDWTHENMKRLIRLQALEFLAEHNPVSFTASELCENGFVTWALEKKDDIYKFLGITVRSDIGEKPVVLIAAILEQLGVNLESYRPRNEKQRVYQLDATSVEMMHEFAQARKKVLDKRNQAEIES